MHTPSGDRDIPLAHLIFLGERLTNCCWVTYPFCFQIHEFYEEFEEARSILRAYRNKNPDNPNAHRLLYEHLQRHWQQCEEVSAQEESLSCLKVSHATCNAPVHKILVYKLRDWCAAFRLSH